MSCQQEEELVYMYQQEGGPVPLPLLGMEQQFAEPPPLADHQERYYTPPLPIPSSNPSRSSNFPSFGGSSSLPNLPFGPPPVENELGQPSQPPSSNFLSFGSTLNFSRGACWRHDGAQGTMQQLQAPERRGRAPACAQEHVIAERKRREKLQQQFVSLATIIPGIKKTDKLSLLGSTIDYVKQLEEKVKALDEQGSRRSSESIVFDSKCRISAADNGTAGPSGRSNRYLGPDIEASILGNTALLSICCRGRKGVLVMVLSEVENQGLSIINTNIVPFTDSYLNITITAKIEEGFSSAVELVKNLKMALRSFN
ncbi:hypothetical protein CFC21_059402 [Triticum aestivum]|uniref:BHLH domain-containing protein n=2 Tax=Triticum aestivum TaxID=4565 RepID=A0A9R1GPE5_WHEAT|nr:hypothetical protein CFC21_059402 [Triticum aestivum]